MAPDMCELPSRRLPFVTVRNPLTPMVAISATTIIATMTSINVKPEDGRRADPQEPRCCIDIMCASVSPGRRYISQDLTSSVVPSCLSGPADEMSALSVSLVPGHWKRKSLPQGSLALLRSRYFCDTRSSTLRGQLLLLSIMYCDVASRTAFTRSRADETCAFLKLRNTAAPTPPAS